MSRDPDKSAAFIALLQPLQRPLEVYCRRMLCDRFQVEDVLQTAVMTAYSQTGRCTNWSWSSPAPRRRE